MATIAEQLTSLANTKAAIKDAIVAKGVTVADDTPFSGYAEKIGEISGGGGAPATKYGVSIDDLLGDVDENGQYVRPTKKFTLNLNGVKTLSGMKYMFFENQGIEEVVANDVTKVLYYACEIMCRSAKNLKTVSFNSLEHITAERAFSYAFYDCPVVVPSFSKLKTVSGNRVFEAVISRIIDADKIFPSLEEVSGYGALSGFITFKGKTPVVLSKLKKITGDASQYGSIFGSHYLANIIFCFPRVTEVTNYILNISSSYTGELHFAAANQAAIEACAGYDKKWGFAGATIYFDLMLTIVVNGVEYSRELTMDGYTSWKDESGNTVYTDATAEPAVGTVVYSDAGTTQVGTVSEVA